MPLNSDPGKVTRATNSLLRDLEYLLPAPARYAESKFKFKMGDNLDAGPSGAKFSAASFSEIRKAREKAKVRVSALTARLAASKMLQDSIQRELEASEKAYGFISQAHDEIAAHLVSVPPLPDDVVSLILHDALSPYKLTPFETNYILVCRRWRTILLSDSRFWSIFEWRVRPNGREGFSLNMAQLHRRLRLSRSASLTIYIINRAKKGEKMELLQMDLLYQRRSSWKVLEIVRMNYEPWISNLLRPIDNLQNVTISPANFDTHKIEAIRWDDTQSVDPCLKSATSVSTTTLYSCPNLFKNVEILSNVVVLMLEENTFLNPLNSVRDPRAGLTHNHPGLRLPSLTHLSYSSSAKLHSVEVVRSLQDMHAPQLSSLGFSWRRIPMHMRIPDQSESVAFQSLTPLSLELRLVLDKWPNLSKLQIQIHPAEGFFPYVAASNDSTINSNDKASQCQEHAAEFAAFLRGLHALVHLDIIYEAERATARMSDSAQILEHCIGCLGQPTVATDEDCVQMVSVYGSRWLCPRLESFNIRISHVPIGIEIILAVAKQRALCADVVPLQEMSIDFPGIDEKFKSHLGVYVNNIFDVRTVRDGR